MVNVNLKISDYASRVLGVIKEKFGLNDKSEALNKFAEMFGDDFIEKDAKDEYVKKILHVSEEHFKKYGYKKMSLAELNKLCEV
ncbi:MAG: antitoxin [archaeon]